MSEGQLFLNPLEALYLVEHVSHLDNIILSCSIILLQGNLIVVNEDHVMSLEEVSLHS